MAGKREFTIDEWFYHWLADEKKYKDALKLFIKIYEICDKITLQQNTRLAHKFYQLDEESGKWPQEQRTAVRFIKNLFLSNSLKIKWVDGNPEIPDEIEILLPRKDVYLIKICLQTSQKILITTDQPLHDQLLKTQQVLGITPFMLSVFSDRYHKNPDEII